MNDIYAKEQRNLYCKGKNADLFLPGLWFFPRLIKNRMGMLILVLLSGSLLISSCSKSPTYSIGTSDLDMVYTQYDDGISFTDYKTYSITDSLNIDDEGLTHADIEYLRDYYDVVFDKINANMQERNYVRVDSTEDPELGISVSIVTKENYVISWGYWWDWGYYGDPYYWGYPGYGYYYPWGTYMGSYEEGALIIELMDLKNPNLQKKKLNALWAGLVGGVLSNNEGLIDDRLIDQIDQAFEQSPYLKTNP